MRSFKGLDKFCDTRSVYKVLLLLENLVFLFWVGRHLHT